MVCPHCGKVPYPAFNEDRSINWKNVFRIDWIAVLMVISILLLLLGVRQINDQCYKIINNPCKELMAVKCPLDILPPEEVNNGNNPRIIDKDYPTS